MDGSLWMGEQPQPNLRPKEQVPTLILWFVLQRQRGLCSFWEHLCSLMLSHLSFWLLQGLGCSPARPSLSLLVLGLGASAEESHLLPGLSQEQVRTPGASARAEISVVLEQLWSVLWDCLCIAHGWPALMAHPNPKAVECFWIEWSPALGVG